MKTALPTNPNAIPSRFERLFPHPSLPIAVGLAIVTILIYFRATTYPFVCYDDDEYVYRHDRVIQGLTPTNFWWSWTGVHSDNWHPLTWLSHLLDSECFGANAGGHHLTSILLHAATAVGLLFALWRLTGELWPSSFVAAVFALHPLHVESVAWVSERKDVLSGFFFVLTLHAYGRYVEAPSPDRYLIVALLFLLGLMSKPMVITLPCVLLLLDYWPLRRLSLGQGNATAQVGTRCSHWQLFREKIPLFVIAAGSALITMNAQTRALGSGDSITLAHRIPNAIVSYQDYLVQSFYPVDMAVFYPHPKDTLPTWKVVVASLLLLTISMAAILLRRKAPYFLVGWFWYLGMLVPVIGVIQVGWQARADRYMYLPQVGLTIAVTWGIKDGLRLSRPILLTAAILVLGTFALQSWKQVTYWADSESLFTHSLSCTGPSVIGHLNLGVTFIEKGRNEEALTHLQKAFELNPDYWLTRFNLTGLHRQFGAAATRRGDHDEAIRQFQVAREYLPKDEHIARVLATAYLNRGTARVIQKRLTEALLDFQQSVDTDPEFAKGYSALGGTLFDLGRYEEAIVAFRRAVALNPKDTLAQRFLKDAIDKSKGKK